MRRILSTPSSTRIVEHLFIGETLRHLWTREIFDAEILRSKFNADSYDPVLETPEHDLDAAAATVAALVIPRWLIGGSPTGMQGWMPCGVP